MYMRINSLIGEKQAKTNRSVTQAEVAEYVGLSPQAFSKWVNNDVRSYSAEVLDKLCEFFECEPGDILYRAKDEAATLAS